MKRLLSAISEPRKTSSSYGNYALLCEVEYRFANGQKHTIEENQFFWTREKAYEVFGALMNGRKLESA